MNDKSKDQKDTIATVAVGAGFFLFFLYLGAKVISAGWEAGKE